MAKRKLSDSEDENNSLKKLYFDVSWNNYLHYNEITRLEHSTLVKIVVVLWKHPDIRKTIENHSSKYGKRRGLYRNDIYSESLRELYFKVCEKAELLNLPRVLQERIRNLIPPVGLEILSWLDDSRDFNFHSSSLIESLRWTSEGLIDRIETLVTHQKLREYDQQIFLYACEYCIENVIVDAWNALSKDIQEETISTYTRGSETNYLVVYWTHCFHNQLLPVSHDIFINYSACNEAGSIYENMFTLAVIHGNLLAVKYFFNKLTDLEVSDFLSKWINLAVNQRRSHPTLIYQQNNQRTDILIFMITKVSDTNRRFEIVRKISHDLIPAIFYDYPWQKYLPSTLNLVWDVLAEKDLASLFYSLHKEIRAERSVEPRLFLQLWNGCPYHSRKVYIQHIINTNSGREVVCKLLETHNFEAAKSIFQTMDDEEKKSSSSLLLQKSRPEFCRAIFHEKYDDLDVVMSILKDNNQINTYKQEIASNLGSQLCESWLKVGNWKAVECFLNWCYNSSELITKFKHEIVDKTSVSISLVAVGNYKILDEFLKWSSRTEEEVVAFKPELAYYEWPRIITKFRSKKNNYNLFLKFVNFCYSSEEDIEKFRLHILSKNDSISEKISQLLQYYYDFDFASKLLSWCFQSDDKIEEFKSNFLLSYGYAIFEKFVTNDKVYCSEFNHWALVLKLVQFFHPLQKSTIDDFKQLLLRSKYIFGPEINPPSFTPKGKKRALFYLLDNYSRRRDDDNAFNCGLDYQEINDEHDTLRNKKNDIEKAQYILTAMCRINDIHFEGPSLEIIDFLDEMLDEIEVKSEEILNNSQ